MITSHRPSTLASSVSPPQVRRRAGQALAVGVFSVLLVACASTPPPTAELAAGRAAVEGAQASGAREFAGAELEAARNKLDLAQQASSRGDNDLARRLAEAAEADARLALARAYSARSNNAASQVERGLQTLQEELQRKPQ